MTEPEKITPAQIQENQEQLKAKYEADTEAAQAEILALKNTVTKKNDEIFDLQKDNKTLAADRDDWKVEAHKNRRIEQTKQATKQTNDFLTEFTKLQETKTTKRN